MQSDEFDYILKQQFKAMEHVLAMKATEYARDDRLHNFKQAANLMQVTQKEACMGFLAKHIVSVFDMCKDEDNGWSLEAWDEKIGDAINYLVLLKAIVYENAMDYQPELPMDEVVEDNKKRLAEVDKQRSGVTEIIEESKKENKNA